MDVTPLISADQKVIQSYSTGRIKISSEVYEHPVLVYPDRVEKWNLKSSVNDLKLNDFQQIFDMSKELDVILLGCGEKGVFIPPKFKSQFKPHGLSLDAMDTGAACRTYNVLMAEGRRIVAALIPI